MMSRRFRSSLAALLLVLLPAGATRGAVDEPIANRIRKAVRLPQVNFQFKFGFTDGQDWLSEPQAADSQAALDRLRSARQPPHDAETLDQIARLTDQLGDKDAIVAATKAAVAGWRKRAEAAPDDRAVQTAFARALRLDHEYVEAERVLRKIAVGTGAAWEARYELATVLGELAMHAYYVGPDGGPGPFTGGAPITPAAADEAKRRNDEAFDLADRLVESAPSEARGWTRRARLRTNRTLMDGAGDLAKAAKAEGDGKAAMRLMYPAIFPPAAVPDLEAALRLRPDDPRLVFGLLLHRIAAALPDLMDAGLSGAGPEGFGRLSTTQQGAVQDALARLERIASGDDKQAGGVALELSACIQLTVMGNRKASGATALRALRMDPHRGDAFDLALGAVVSERKPDWAMAETVVRERLKGRSDERTRLILAKVVNEAGRPDEAIAEVHAALKANPRQPWLEVALVALRIRQSQIPGPSGETSSVDTARRLIDAMPDGPDKGALMGNFFVTLSGLLAISGNPADARRMLDQLSEKLPDDEYVKAMAALVKQVP